MTLTADVVGDLHRADAALADLDPDSDLGFFSMSPASAEQVTLQIRTMLDRGWEYIALAYKGRAFAALGYPTWDEYVDARLGDFRLAVPREHRARVVATLAGVRMSVRAIAKLLGVGVGTVHRELIKQQSGVPDGTPDDGSASGTTLGTDGKHYPRTRKPAGKCCVFCGDNHPPGTEECPWDKYAQGIGPHPDTEESVDGIPTRRPRDSAEGAEDPLGGSPDRKGVDPRSRTQPSTASDVAMQAIESLQSVADQAAVLPDLLSDLELAIESDAIVARSDILSLRLKKLDDSLGVGMESWCSIVQRLRLVIRSLDEVLPTS